MDARVAETHSAVVVFVDDRAYKLKKPVNLGFLDFSTREARYDACHREVALNRRLAPDVYLGVADVSGPDGEPCDHLVVMRRMPDERRLSSLVESGADVGPCLRQLAHQLVTFHAAAHTSPDIDRAAGTESARERWEANLRESDRFAGRWLDPAALTAVRVRAERYLDGRGPLFAARVAAGRARDGHGDLLADDIFCLPDGPRVLDCLDFDDRLRWDDVLADISFLAMDLERLGGADLARSFLDLYRELSGDSWPASLAHHHIAHRALVRAKVACIRAEQGDAAAPGLASAHLALALRHLDAARVRLVLVGGLPGTGKSTLAGGIGDALGAVVLRSDIVRKELSGRASTDRATAAPGAGIYAAPVTEATYTELLDRASTALSLGEIVVLDASFNDDRWRQAASEVAQRTASDLVELRCVVPAEVAAARIRDRLAGGADPSDATEAVASAMAAATAPWPSATTIDTSGPLERASAAALHAVTSSP